MDAQGERLLQDLVNQEKSLVAQVKDARSKAAGIIEAAEKERDKILQEARSTAEASATREAEAAAKEAEAAREAIVQVARDSAAALVVRAQAGKDRAVALVMEKVLP